MYLGCVIRCWFFLPGTKEKCGKPWIPRREIEEEEKRRRLSVLEEEAVKRKEHELSRFVVRGVVGFVLWYKHEICCSKPTSGAALE